MTVRISPSILSADFVNLERELQRIRQADMVHVDVMDGHFVPNLTFGQGMVARLQQVSPIPLDVHLMIDNPDRWAPDYADAGAFSVTFHVEAIAENGMDSVAGSLALAAELRARGARAGLAIKPGTAVEPFLDYLDEFDQLLIMTVEPGFGGQKFMSEMMPKVRLAADAIAASDSDVWLQVDGGITVETIAIAAENGANNFVAGSAVFGAPEPDDQIIALRSAAHAE